VKDRQCENQVSIPRDKLLFQYSGLQIAYFIYKVWFFISKRKLKTLEELHNKIDRRIVYILDIQNYRLISFLIFIPESHSDYKRGRKYVQIIYKLDQFYHVISTNIVGLWTQYLWITFLITSEVSIWSLKSDKYILLYFIQVLKDDCYLTKRLNVNHKRLEMKSLGKLQVKYQ